MKKRLILSSLASATALAAAVVSTSAFAADPAPPAGSRAKQQSGDPAQPADPTQPAATPPASGATLTVSGNGVTAGTPATPTQDQPQTAKKPEEKAPKPRPFAGTQVFVQQTMNLNVIAPGLQQTRNPTADASVWMLPRYTINKDWQLRGRWIFSYEETNSDSTATKNEPRFGDLTAQLFYRSIPEIGKTGIKPMLNASLMFPVSSESRARTMVVTPGIGYQLVKSFEHVLGGELSIIHSGNYTHPFYRYTTPGIRDDAPYQRQCYGGFGCAEQLSGAANPSDTLSWSFIVAGEWGKWSPALFFLGGHAFPYTFKEQPGLSTAKSENPNSVRQTTYFSAWLDYNANSWLTVEGGYYMFRNILNDDGTYGNPLWSRYQDMRLYLGVNLNIDNIAKELEGGGGEGGVVRAKNDRRPSLAF